MKKKIFITITIILFLIIIGATLYFFKPNKIQSDDVQDTIPYLLDEECEIIEEDVKKGMTIKDSFGNEFVWIVVPKTEVFKTATDETDYNGILMDIKEYVKDYSQEGYKDNEVPENVLASIYNYGGFWISRYEIGVEAIRNGRNESLQIPISKPNKFVYNYVTYNQAKELATKISDSKYDSNLLYGFQWDLVCKYIEENGYNSIGEKITQEMINNNSSLWGNYYSSDFIINRGQYSLNYGKDYISAENEETKEAYKNYLFTTGASEQNKACNIYDFAGNVSEWTLENSIENLDYNIIRDGSFYFNYGGNDPVSGRYIISPNSSNNSYGFRISITKTTDKP